MAAIVVVMTSSAAYASGTGTAAQTVANAAYSVQSVMPWKQNAAPVGWSSSLNRVIYNSRGSNGLFNAYSANPDGSDPECLTCSEPTFTRVGTATNRGASSVSPNGQYMLVTVEEPVHGGRVGAPDTAPGAGADNNVWLYTTDGQHAWPLTDIAAQGGYGSNAPHFDQTGNEIVWASLYAPALLDFGYWELKVANITWTDGVPALTDIRMIDPIRGRFYEPYGFTPDDQHIIFASNAGEGLLLDDQIDTIDVNGTGFTQLTHSIAGVVVNYHEFAWYTPNGNAIIYGTSLNATSGGMDYWTMNPDGTNQQRLTFFNEPWSTETLGGYSVVESLAFNPNDPNQFIAAVSTDMSSRRVNAYAVTLQPPPATGLTEQIFNGPNFGTLLETTTQNPSDGFDTRFYPAPNLSTTDYSIRWSGAVMAPETGAYSLCLVAMPEGQLLVDGKQALSTLGAAGRRKCATVTATAGSSIPVEVNFEHQYPSAPSYEQLSWTVPGESTPTLIPSAWLSATAPSGGSGAGAGTSSGTATGTGTSSGTSGGKPKRSPGLIAGLAGAVLKGITALL